MRILQDIITSAREVRSDLKLDPKAPLEALLVVRDGTGQLVEAQKAAIEKITRMTIEISTKRDAAVITGRDERGLDRAGGGREGAA